MVNQSCLTTLEDLNTPIQNASYNLKGSKTRRMGQPLKQTPICKQMPGCANRRLAKSAQHLRQRTTRNRGCFLKRLRLVRVRASQHAGNTADVCKGRRGLGRDGHPTPMLQDDQIPPRTEEDKVLHLKKSNF